MSLKKLTAYHWLILLLFIAYAAGRIYLLVHPKAGSPRVAPAPARPQ